MIFDSDNHTLADIVTYHCMLHSGGHLMSLMCHIIHSLIKTLMTSEDLEHASQTENQSQQGKPYFLSRQTTTPGTEQAVF